MKDEIIAGLKNALERGQPLEAAAQSFINAGYNPQEVKAAAAAISEGVSEIIYPKRENEKFSEQVPEAPLPAVQNRGPPALPVMVGAKQKNSSGKKTAIIIVIVLMLLVFVSALTYLIYYFLK